MPKQKSLIYKEFLIRFETLAGNYALQEEILPWLTVGIICGEPRVNL
jgi:hypothetical protein